MIPAAELDGAGKLSLIVAVYALDHQQRTVVQLEIEAVIVADAADRRSGKCGAGSPL